MVDEERFLAIRDRILSETRQRHGIGMLAEKNVHAIVKDYYEPDEDHQEIPLEGCVADIYKDGSVIEIQNGNFTKLKKKLEKFLPLYQVTVVYPLPRIRYLIWVDEETGEMSDKRKSPRKGTVYDMFWELCKIRPFLEHENFTLKILMMDVEEYRLLNGWGRGGKKGSTREERVPFHLVEEYVFSCPQDYMQLVPYELPQRFTVKQFAKAAKIPEKKAQSAITILRQLHVIEKVGTLGRAYLYEAVDIP